MSQPTGKLKFAYKKYQQRRTMNNKSTKGNEMIKSGRELAQTLENTSVKIENCSKALARKIQLWASRSEIKIENGLIVKNW